jgi:hypothetical protein
VPDYVATKKMQGIFAGFDQNQVAKAVSRWRQEAITLGIPATEIDLVASAFDHEDLSQARNQRIATC